MDRLQARSPAEGLLPLTVGAVTLEERPMERITSVAPFRGQEQALSTAMQTAHGVAFPTPGRMHDAGGTRSLWFGMGQAMLIGPEPDAALGACAALTDQSDAWAVVELVGPHAEDVLARLVPVDLRAPGFGVGHTARTMLAHMNVSVTRTADDGFMIMAFRSMAGTLVHDLSTAMAHVAARRDIAAAAR